MGEDDKRNALRDLLKERCPDIEFSDDDIHKLVGNGYTTAADLAASTKGDLVAVLPGRLAKVGVLFKAFLQPAAGQATPEQDDRLQKLLEGFVKMMTDRFEVVARKSHYRISEANSTVFQEIRSSRYFEEIKNVEVLFDASKRFSKHKARDVPIFEWGVGVESGQAAGYVEYVQQYLVQFDEKWSVINGNQHHSLLNGILKGNGKDPEFRGTTDVVVIEKIAEGLPRSGLKILFELMKDGTNDTKAEYQTICALLLANTLCRHLRPVAVLTDLDKMWKFFLL